LIPWPWISEIEILAGHFYKCEENEEDLKEDLMCKWKKFKYNLLQLKSEIPMHVLNPEKS